MRRPARLFHAVLLRVDIGVGSIDSPGLSQTRLHEHLHALLRRVRRGVEDRGRERVDIEDRRDLVRQLAIEVRDAHEAAAIGERLVEAHFPAPRFLGLQIGVAGERLRIETEQFEDAGILHAGARRHAYARAVGEPEARLRAVGVVVVEAVVVVVAHGRAKADAILDSRIVLDHYALVGGRVPCGLLGRQELTEILVFLALVIERADQRLRELLAAKTQRRLVRVAHALAVVAVAERAVGEIVT